MTAIAMGRFQGALAAERTPLPLPLNASFIHSINNYIDGVAGFEEIADYDCRQCSHLNIARTARPRERGLKLCVCARGRLMNSGNEAT